MTVYSVRCPSRAGARPRGRRPAAAAPSPRDAPASSRKLGPETLIEAITSPCALRIGAAAAVRPDLELVDRDGVPLLAHHVQLGAQLREAW